MKHLRRKKFAIHLATVCLILPLMYRLHLTCVSLPAGLAKGEVSKTDTLNVTYDITNTGDAAGKETIQFYVQKPQGFLGKPSRELIRFAKTELLEPGEGES